MHNPAKAFLIAASLLTSSPAFAQDAQAHMKAIAGATTWKEVVTMVEARFPKTVVDELKVATKDLAFPTIRTFKGNLVLTDGNGGRVTLAFAKNGVALLNGKPIMIDPLATVEAGLASVSGMSGKAASADLLRYLLPEAQAAGMIGAGMAAVAYSGANAWKADACGENTGDEQLAVDCPLMGVPLVHKVGSADVSGFKIINAKCPEQNGGVFEIMSKTPSGYYSRTRVVFSGGKATANVEYKEPGRPYIKDSDGNPAKQAATAERIVNRICSPGPDRDKYLQFLRDNRNALKASGGTLQESDVSSMDL